MPVRAEGKLIAFSEIIIGPHRNEAETRAQLEKLLGEKAYQAGSITILADTGLRVREALSLDWSAVQLDSEPACIIVRTSKTAAGVRAVWLTKHCREVL